MTQTDVFPHYDFALDAFQIQAMDAVEAGHSVLVSAPTGAGKTLIAEYVMARCLNRGRNVIYTAPIKALSNQKFREFQALFPNRVGIVTGDVSINPDAPLTIMTTEIYRNRLLERRDDFNAYAWVIYDEIHYLDDPERGTVWEESLILKPDHMRLLGLSATIPNIEALAAWMREIFSSEVVVIREDHRPVPQHLFFQVKGEITDNLDQVRRWIRRRNRHEAAYRSRSGPGAVSRPEPLLVHLAKTDRVPLIYFSFSRKRCEWLADLALRVVPVEKNHQEVALERYDVLCERFGIADSERAAQMRRLVSCGIAYHHAGLHPMLKEVVERLFSDRSLRMIFTTETFALGINMPARTVVIDEIRKRYGRFFRTLKNRDFSQMAGRSGRRGIDREGFIYCRLAIGELLPTDLDKLFRGEPEPVNSRLNTSYATILNLYEVYGEAFIDIYRRSFHCFAHKGRASRQQEKLMRDRLQVLTELGCVHNGRLTPRGHFARRMYGYELSLSQLYASGTLERLSVEQLAAICLAVVFEPRPGTRRVAVPREFRRLRAEVSALLRPVHLAERRLGIPDLSKSFAFDLTALLLSWMREPSFDRLIQQSEHDEGEIIRYFRMTVQVLREMRDAPLSAALRRRLEEAVSRINQGFIDAENQLRLGLEADAAEQVPGVEADSPFRGFPT
ncbi:MAG: DEAD/DEAH box helicase [Acidobacteriota bacterium]|nr:DEAD/DEAH box helicase [Acidobacteriota bacterium]